VRCRFAVVGVRLMLSKVVTIGWLLVWVTGEGIGSSIVCTLEPLGSEIVTMIRIHIHCRRGFSTSSKRCELRIGMRELWSVTIVKWPSPARKRWHLLMAQATARHSSSITAYQLSASVRNLEPASTTLQSGLLLVGFWRRRKPKPRVLVSVWRRVSLEGSK